MKLAVINRLAILKQWADLFIRAIDEVFNIAAFISVLRSPQIRKRAAKMMQNEIPASVCKPAAIFKGALHDSK